MLSPLPGHLLKPPAEGNEVSAAGGRGMLVACLQGGVTCGLVLCVERQHCSVMHVLRCLWRLIVTGVWGGCQVAAATISAPHPKAATHVGPAQGACS